MFFGRSATSASSIVLVSSLALSSFSLLSACGQSTQTASKPTTVDIPNTQAKWQSIGNCWIYSFASWAESLVLTSSEGRTSLNLSESYLTYRHYQVQLTNRSTPPSEVQTGGFWTTARDLSLRYGLVREGAFAPEEENATFSARQKAATAYINESLKNGKLNVDRSPATVKAELNIAFNVDIDAIAAKAVPATSVVLSKPGAPLRTLDSEMRTWTGASWSGDWATMPSAASELPYYRGKPTAAQEAILRRVKRALNANAPVVLDWFVDFNALTSKGVFSGAALKAAGPGRQGFHSVVVEDYTVEGINPTTGEKFVIGEGEATPAEKVLAAEYGTITSFIIKNSWGGLERVDRKSYVRNGVGGFHKLDADYLFGWLARNDEKTGEFIGAQSGLTRFTLPPGF